MNTRVRTDRFALTEFVRWRWFELRNLLRHCPECGRRGYYPHAPRWEDDKTALMLGCAGSGCPCRGKREIA